MKEDEVRPGRNWDRNCFIKAARPFWEVNELKTVSHLNGYRWKMEA